MTFAWLHVGYFVAVIAPNVANAEEIIANLHPLALLWWLAVECLPACLYQLDSESCFAIGGVADTVGVFRALGDFLRETVDIEPFNCCCHNCFNPS